jgi:AcrR family transcriptional regulator
VARDQPGVNFRLAAEAVRVRTGAAYDQAVPEASDDPRARAGATKRLRTRAALLAAATQLFETRGWAGTRMEDIATAAGVSSATAYNHFPTKHAIVGAAYEPVLSDVTLRLEQAGAGSGTTVELLCTVIRDAAVAARARTNLTVAFTSAVQEAAALREGRPLDPEDPNDPRSYVQLPAAVARVVTDAQRTGELRAFPDGREVAASMMNLLLLRVMNRRAESPATTAEVVLTLLFGALKPELLVAAGPDGRPFASPDGHDRP